VANARIHKGILGIHWFSLYNFLLFVGAVFVALRGDVSNFASIVLGNMFVICGYLALFVSLTRFFGKSFSDISRQFYLQVAFSVVGLAAMLQWGWLRPDTDKRLLAFSVVLCAQQAHIALFAARKERRNTHAAASMAIILAALAAMNTFRIGTILIQGVPQDYLSVKGALVLMVLINGALQCAATVAYIWMTASLLRGDLVHQAATDPLTGLLNRRAMDRAAQQVLAYAAPGCPTSAIAIDLNDFKRINDTFGHATGDAVLTAVARTLQLGLRHSDFVGRMGGDEFIALLPDTPVETARQIAAKLHSAVCSIAVPHSGNHASETIGISASFGCSQVETRPEAPVAEWGALLIECDKLLYKSKGRRRSDSATRPAHIAQVPERSILTEY
jgi:diguanylate cyclase (GGDEF)-like protein